MIVVLGASTWVGSELVRLLTRARVEVVADRDRCPHVLDGTSMPPPTVVLAHVARDVLDRFVADPGSGHVVHVAPALDPALATAPRRTTRSGSIPRWTTLRTNVLMQDLLTLAPMVRDTDGFGSSMGDGRMGLVDARDVAAAAAVVALEPDRHPRDHYRISGQSELGLGDLAQELEVVLGRAIEYRRLDPATQGRVWRRAGVPDGRAAKLARRVETIARGDAEWTSLDLTHILGAPARTLRHFLEDHQSAFESDDVATWISGTA